MTIATGAQYYGVRIYKKGKIYPVLDIMTKEGYLLMYGQESSDPVWIDTLPGSKSTWNGTDSNQCHEDCWTN